MRAAHIPDHKARELNVLLPCYCLILEELWPKLKRVMRASDLKESPIMMTTQKLHR